MTIAFSLPIAGGALCLLVASAAALVVSLFRRGTPAPPAIEIESDTAIPEREPPLYHASMG